MGKTTRRGDLVMSKNVVIDGVEYAPIFPAQPNGNRAVVVVDRGWIFAGDVTEENGRIYLDRAVWVFRWESCGFAAVVADPGKADIRPLTTRVDIPEGSEIFRMPVAEDWGM
jgi:hypothetical protein